MSHHVRWSRSHVPHVALAALCAVQPNTPVVFGDPLDVPDLSPTLTLGEREIVGSLAIARFILRSVPSNTLYSGDTATLAEIDMWVDWVLQAGSAPQFEFLNQVLQSRTFLVNDTVSLADLALWGTTKAIKFTCSASNAAAFPHVVRWLSNMELQQFVRRSFVKKTTKDEMLAKYADVGSFEIDLPGASDGNICTRFPPEPSGYLHIGHVKAALLNNYFAHEKFRGGRLLLRYDDTNPCKEKEEFLEAIKEDLGRLGLQPDHTSFTSDHFKLIETFAWKLIRDGKAYVDDTPVDKLREMRGRGEASPMRDLPVAEVERLFSEILAGSERGQQCCLRAKIDMSLPNKCMRDPIIYRCKMDVPHLRTGTTFKAYPSYDFACPIVDSHEGVTHALRTTEYHDRNPQYYWFIEALGLRPVHIWDFSRMNFTHTVLSKRKLQWFVNEGLVEGWFDPRFPTVQGVLRRGMTVEALKTFIMSQGASKSICTMEWDKIWAINRSIIDFTAERHESIFRDPAPVRVTVTNADGSAVAPSVRDVLKYQTNRELGSREFASSGAIWLDQEDAQNLREGEEVTLMHWGNAIISSLVRNEGGLITSGTAVLNLRGDVKKTKKLQFLPCHGSGVPDNIEATLVEYGHLLTKAKIEEGDNFEQFVNRNSKKTREAFVDHSCASLRKGQFIQLQRRGYFIVDAVTPKLVLNLVPDGRSTADESAAKKGGSSSGGGARAKRQPKTAGKKK